MPHKNQLIKKGVKRPLLTKENILCKQAPLHSKNSTAQINQHWQPIAPDSVKSPLS